jgi:hypothetical protein
MLVKGWHDDMDKIDPNWDRLSDDEVAAEHQAILDLHPELTSRVARERLEREQRSRESRKISET